MIGAGIAGLGAAWLLSRRHRVVLFEQAAAAGGHAHTAALRVAGTEVAVDTGFIVYNEPNYPHLVALFSHLGVPTVPSDMSFSVSLRGGRLEYAGTDLNGLFAQRRNLLSPRFWRMLADIRRFYRAAPGYLADASEVPTIGELLDRAGYSSAFLDDHLMPMAAAIWSASRQDVRDYPAAAFLRFFDNHGLLRLRDRPLWRTVVGGSREYVRRLLADAALELACSTTVRAVGRDTRQVWIETAAGTRESFAAVVFAVAPDQALALLGAAASAHERRVLGAFAYSDNGVWLHGDESLMPRRRAAWASWNYLEASGHAPGRPLCVSYWMNRLQPLATARDLFVTLNPPRPPAAALTFGQYRYRHPIFTPATALAQHAVHRLQGRHRSWYCGAWCGHGFHEDGLQSGLWVAEQLGVPRPWSLPYDRLPAGMRGSLAQAA